MGQVSAALTPMMAPAIRSPPTRFPGRRQRMTAPTDEAMTDRVAIMYTKVSSPASELTAMAAGVRTTSSSGSR